MAWHCYGHGSLTKRFIPVIVIITVFIVVFQYITNCQNKVQCITVKRFRRYWSKLARLARLVLRPIAARLLR